MLSNASFPKLLLEFLGMKPLFFSSPKKARILALGSFASFPKNILEPYLSFWKEKSGWFMKI